VATLGNHHPGMESTNPGYFRFSAHRSPRPRGALRAAGWGLCGIRRGDRVPNSWSAGHRPGSGRRALVHHRPAGHAKVEEIDPAEVIMGFLNDLGVIFGATIPGARWGPCARAGGRRTGTTARAARRREGVIRTRRRAHRPMMPLLSGLPWASAGKFSRPEALTAMARGGRGA